MPVQLIELQAGAPEAFGHPDLDPARRAITSAFEALAIHVGLDQGNRVAVAPESVLAEASQLQTQAVGGQAR